ncbi:Rhodanese-related sulfurtransferase [Peptoclostridium litorale DSM 5388]|uniref:Rhodanese domain-containing protein n=1 Tax=Peptoclostridium litorale DSM 5388 TaxID=1121324 RepID=A0A069RMM8_PEPLI|nr:rhodanese-like domain-containing protein [Peptoclostridium litorale]KDR95442.1 rhodanese domain-containing protein [Peptoclostridium litorale DSM 5388]SIO18666.1 Rhodanese-related sulfurtransferase [Peptoclostridium litorale DSM 5388]
MAQLTHEVQKYFNELKCGSNNLITLDDLLKRIEEKDEIFMLDIRKKEDYSKGHIKGAFHAEWSEIGEFIEDDVFSKEEKIIVICYSGQSAGQAVGILKSLGYNACSLKGGMIANSENDNLNIEASCST